MEQKLNSELINFDIEIMKTWCNSLTDSSKASSDDYDKFLKILYDVVLELSTKDFFKKDKIDGEGENFFITNLGPKIITNILVEKMKEQGSRSTARDILEIFIQEFGANMSNTKFSPIWEAVLSCFDDSKKFYSNLEAYDIGDRFWVSNFIILYFNFNTNLTQFLTFII